MWKKKHFVLFCFSEFPMIDVTTAAPSSTAGTASQPRGDSPLPPPYFLTPQSDDIKHGISIYIGSSGCTPTPAYHLKTMTERNLNMGIWTPGGGSCCPKGF